MAIKGKGKTRPRPVARAPRREPVPVKPPFFTRRLVQVAIAFVAGVLVMMFLVWITNGLREQRREERTREREAAALQRTRTVVSDWQGVVETAVTGLGGEIAGPGIPPTLLPAASAAIDGAAAGNEVEGAGGTLDEAATSLSNAIGSIDGYDLLGELRDRGFDINQTNYLLNSKTKILEALRVYRESVAVAQRADGDRQLGRIAAALRDRAATLFADGWRDLEQVKQSVGIDLLPDAAP